MDTGGNAPGTRPVNIVYLSGEAQPLKCEPNDRRFMVVPDLPVPAPASWPWPREATAPTDAPVLRNELWDALRSIERGVWTVAVFSSGPGGKLLASQDYVVDDFGNLVELTAAAAARNADLYASTYAIDAAACDWMDQFSAPTPAGSALRSMANAAARKPVRATILDEPYHDFCSASVVLDDDPQWHHGQPLYSIHVAAAGDDRLLLTHTQLCALALALLDLVRPAPAGSLQ